MSINIMTKICQIVGICDDKIGMSIWSLDGSYCSTQISQSVCIGLATVRAEMLSLCYSDNVKSALTTR